MANTCDDGFQELLNLQKQLEAKQRQLAESERARKAGEQFTRAEVGDQIILPGAGRTPRILDTKELSRGLQQLANSLDSDELMEFVKSSLGLKARPVGADGRFQNYDRILREIDIQDAEDYARLAEALGHTWKDVAPEDFAFTTQVYGREKMAQVVADALGEFGVTVPDVLARMTNDAAGFSGLVERMARIRLFSMSTKRQFMDATGRIADFMDRLPGAVVPDDMKQAAFKQYKLALLGERHFAYARRRTAQTLRSLQEGVGEVEIPDFTDVPWITPEASRLDPDGADAPAVKGPEETLGLTPDDVSNDSVIGKIIEAVDNGPAGLKDLLDILDTLRTEGIDSKAKLDEGWFNATMRRFRAFAKDSQLSGITTQLKSGEMTNIVMMFYGPLQKTFKNGMVMVPVGTDSLKRLGLVESAKISARAYTYALEATRIGFGKMFHDTYFHGLTHFGGNPDVYGRRMSSNADVDAEVNRIAKQGWSEKNYLANIAMVGPKLNAHARLLLKKLHKDIPLQPALRMLGTFDEIHGKFQYMFHLKADLEVKARAEAVTLGLDTLEKRNAWVEQQLEEAVYQTTPTEANIKAFRKQAKKGDFELPVVDGVEVPLSKMTDQQVMDLMAQQRMAGAPTFNQASVRAFNYAAETRMQNTPGSELLKFGGSTLDPIRDIDRAVVGLKKNWMFDTALPYWRAPANALLFDLRLATSPFYDPIKMATLALKGKAGSEEFAEVASRWAIAMGLVAFFGMADEAGWIEGNNNPDPAKRNSFNGVPYLGGLPILSTLFLWKDVKDALTEGGASDMDGNEAYNGIVQVLTGYIMRGTGIAQLQQLVSAFSDGNMDAWDALVAFGGFQIQGNVIPFSGALRSIDRTLGTDIGNQYRDGKDSPQLRYNQGVLEADVDDPFAPVLKKLRDLAYNTVPVIAGLPGSRKDQDWLGSPRGHIAGIDFAKVIPIGFPGAWPRDPIYAELESMGQLDPPVEFRRRNLEGVGMSAALQREAIDIYGSVPGNSLLATFALTGKSVNVSLPIKFGTVLPDGVRIVDGETVRIDLAPFLEKHVKGKPIADALRSLFNDPLFQAMEGDPQLTSNRALRDQPPAVRRRQPAQLMVKAIKDYYLELTKNELEVRAREGTSPEAKAWSDGRKRNIEGATQNSLNQLQPLIKLLGGAR